MTEGEKEEAARREAAGSPSLPCLFGNNCNGDRVNLSGYQKKRADSVSQNVAAFVQAVGVERLAFLTLTFDAKRWPGLTVKEALKKFHSFNTGFFAERFGAWVRVVEFQRNGMPHFHLVIECRGDVRSGFDFEYFARVQAWQRIGCLGPKPRGSLHRNAFLKSLHDALNATAPRYGFGRCELAPVKSADAMGWYVGGYMSKSLAHRPLSAKGSRFVAYSKGFNRRVKGPFSRVTPAAWVWRQKLGTYAAKHGILGDMQTICDGLKTLFGTHWAYQCKEAILKSKLSFWPSVAHCKADSTCEVGMCPDDATDIRRISFYTNVIDYHALARAHVAGPPSREKPLPGDGRRYVLKPTPGRDVRRQYNLLKKHFWPLHEAAGRVKEKNETTTRFAGKAHDVTSAHQGYDGRVYDGGTQSRIAAARPGRASLRVQSERAFCDLLA